ncbi:MAG: phytanoyl-CoA dioxygenase family protein [Gammaproteobacteria bacterium]
MTNKLLPKRNAEDEVIAQEWQGDNQQWWNWYMGSADNVAAPVEPSTDVIQMPGTEGAVSLAAIGDELKGSYAVDPEAIARFRRDGYVKLQQVLSADALGLLRGEMERCLVADLGANPGLEFRSGEMMWLDNKIFRAFVLSPRLAEIAAVLLGVPSVRLYHDNSLAKEPGCGRTPWHYDKDHFPIASPDICTAWIPLQSVPRSMGPLAFAVGMDVHELVESVPFSKFDTSYDQAIAEIFQAHDVPVDDGPFALGEISFHHAYSFHTAGPNRTDESRMVLATTYFADGARVVPQPTMISGDWRKFMPGVEAGETIASAYNPVCFPPAS